MKKVKLLLFIVVSVLAKHSNAQQIAFANFNVCNQTVPACNPFFQGYTCGNIQMKTMYGAPKFVSYNWDHQGTPETNWVVRLSGTQKVINGQTKNVDEGIEFEYLFKTNTNYRITVVASGHLNSGSMIGKCEVILGTQYSNQLINTCGPDVFDPTSNSGPIVLSFIPSSFIPQAYEAIYQTTTPTLSKVKIRSINTSSDPIVPNSAVLIYSIGIAEGIHVGEDCGSTNVYLNQDITWDYSWPISSPYWGATFGSVQSTTASANFNISNGTYLIVSNNVVNLEPGFNTILGPNGNIKIAVGRCLDGAPLRSGTSEISSDIAKDTRVPDSIKESKFTLFPNPANSELNITFANGLQPKQIIITDNLGRRILTKVSPSNSNKLTLDVSGLKTGIYYLTALNAALSKTYKFTISR